MYNPTEAKFFQLSSHKKDSHVFGYVDLRTNKEYSFEINNLKPIRFRDEDGKLLARTYNKGFKAKVGIPSASIISTEFVQMLLFAGNLDRA